MFQKEVSITRSSVETRTKTGANPQIDEQDINEWCDNRASTTARLTHHAQTATAQQGQTRQTTLQAIVIGDVAIVGVPAEYFTTFGVDIKKRSPFKNIVVAELANDWIGYLPNREAHKLGGYQTWMGLHSYAEEGTGERVADQIVSMLEELAKP